MNASALVMVLSAAVFHASWNLAAKAKRGEPYVFVWWYSIVTALVTLPAGIIETARSGGIAAYGPGLLWAPAVSAGLHMAYNLTLQTGYDRAPLGVVYPTARGTGPMITMIVAVGLLGERPGWTALGGAALIVAGIVITALPGRIPRTAGTAPSHGPAASPISAGLIWGGLTGLFIAGYTLWDDQSVNAFGQSPIPYFAVSSLLQAAFMTLGLNRPRRQQLRESIRLNRWIVLIIGVLSPVSYILVLSALQSEHVSLIAPLRETSIVIGALLAWLIFKEPNPVRRLLGAAVVLGGVGLVSL